MKEYIVKKQENDLRVDRFLSLAIPEISRSFLSKGIKTFVRVDGDVVKQSYKLKEGQRVEVEITKLKGSFEKELKKSDLEGKIIAQKGEVEIFFEDKEYLVLKKPHGLVVHPGVGHEKDTLANYVKGYLIDKGEYDYGVKRAGIVHRLDMPVGGLIVFAKNRQAQKHLSGEFENHRVLKIYLADYYSNDQKNIFEKFHNIQNVYQIIDEFKKDLPLNLDTWCEISGSMKRDSVDRKRMSFQRGIYNEGLRYAQSYLLPLSEERMCVLIKTGRMHQIRATLRSMGLVLKGDKLYGCKKTSGKKIELNSVVLGFTNMNGEKKVFNILNSFI